MRKGRLQGARYKAQEKSVFHAPCPLPHDPAPGFVLPAAIFLLVVLGGLAGWMMQLTVVTQAQDVLAIEGERAYRAAQAGLESGIYSVSSGGGCATQNITFSGELARFTASVSCVSSTANEAGSVLTFYRITSIACNETASGACPNSAPTLAEYAERQVTVSLEE